MRKQYHFRNSSDGILAWDIHKLVLLTSKLKIEVIPLNSILELNEPYWYSNNEIPSCKSIANHMRLVQEADLTYPIILCPNKRVMDGMHRVVKALLEGHTHIYGYFLPTLPNPDYIITDSEDFPYL
ncbi:hypothetical protein [Candidatus Nitrosacidococcus tergens]|uniref:ParB/Sulfiredoxin domain-containing protein n=1 Tax=Candidatus Nitrosacidococcus tergens TaxID=553981 RepID=A0A7G1QB17_9GAMM|nr:hypothetical protein [Candidatus Nitrosacidococcus tergens]CAB1277085.1 conserved protein of unknown function [Candidatus Nitrosacidococcus tergens]